MRAKRPPPPASEEPSNGRALLAAASAGLGVALFAALRLGGGPSGVTLASLAAASVPLDDALRSGRPSLVEFYADWCEVCREMAPDVAAVERGPGASGVNFVMLNVDAPQWAPEMAAYDVNGIPKFVFLDSRGRTLGTASGKTPRDVLARDVASLARGEPLPSGLGTTGPVSALGGGEMMARLPAPSAVATVAAIVPGTSPAVLRNPPVTDAASLYEFSVLDKAGSPVQLSEYKGKVTLVVNVASKCGLTDSNYKGLAELKDKLKDAPFEVLAFPCNGFAGQEPGSLTQICSLAEKYGAKFPIFEKIEVNGKGAAPIYQWLKAKTGGGDIKWNFGYFLVGKNGEAVKRYEPSVGLPSGLEADIASLL